MKRWLLFMLVFGLLFTAVTPAYAAGKSPRSNFTLTGRITAIGNSTVTIQVLAGNKIVKPFVGKELTVTVTDSTRFLFNDGTVTKPITFTDLKIGDPVSVHGKFANDVWTVSRITVGAKLTHFP